MKKQKEAHIVLMLLIIISFSILFSTSVYSAREINCAIDDCTNLKALYHFNGDALDSSGNTHTATVHGGIYTHATGAINGAFDFSELDQYLSIPIDSELNFTDAISISAWINGAPSPTTTWVSLAMGTFPEVWDMQTYGDKIYYIYFARVDDYAQVFTGISNLDGSNFVATQRTSTSYFKGENLELQIYNGKIYYLYGDTDVNNRMKIRFAYSDLDGSNWNSQELPSDQYDNIFNWVKFRIYNGTAYMMYNGRSGSVNNDFETWIAKIKVDGLGFSSQKVGIWNEKWFNKCALEVTEDGVLYPCQIWTWSTCTNVEVLHLCKSGLDLSGFSCTPLTQCVPGTGQGGSANGVVGKLYNSAINGNKMYYFYNEYIYSAGEPQTTSFASSDLNGNNFQVIKSDTDYDNAYEPYYATKLSIVGDRVYYPTLSNPWPLVSMNLLGQDIRTEADWGILPMSIVGNSIYHLYGSDLGLSGSNIISAGNAYGIGVSLNGDFSGYVNAGTNHNLYSGASSADTGAMISYPQDVGSFGWNHVGMRYNKSTGELAIFQNGAEVGSTTYNKAISITDNKILIGDPFIGKIDELAIFDAVLSDSEMTKLYKMRKSPNYSNFPGPMTTDFESVPNIGNVPNPTLQNDDGIVRFGCTVNATDEELNAYVVMKQGVFALDSASMDPTWICPTNISIKVNTCNDVKVYYTSPFQTSLLSIKSGGQICNAGTNPRCDNIVCANNIVNFTAYEFSSYGAEGTGGGLNGVEMNIWNDGPKDAGLDVNFYAKYNDSSTHAFLTGASCNISFSDNWANIFPMTESTTEYNYTKIVNSAMTYNVTCSKSSYQPIMLQDSVSVNGGFGGGVPEFSSWTMMIAIIGVMIGFVMIRRQE